jgi:hypothetical protein
VIAKDDSVKVSFGLFQSKMRRISADSFRNHYNTVLNQSSPSLSYIGEREREGEKERDGCTDSFNDDINGETYDIDVDDLIVRETEHTLRLEVAEL